MPCKISCAISAIFIIGMIFMTFSTTQNNIIAKYENQLPKELHVTYQKIENLV